MVALTSLLATALLPAVAATIPRLTTPLRNGVLVWTDAIVPGVVSVESAPTPAGPWSPGPNAFATLPTGTLNVGAPADPRFFRLRATGLPPTTAGFTNLVDAYGLLETIAGTGLGQIDGVSYWEDWFEGGPANWAALSRPHWAMADRAGNVYIADKGSHSILRVDPEGLIHTHAGTHEGGFNGEGPAPATTLQLNLPNSLWVRADGTVYALDTDNGRVRRITPDGVMTTLFQATSDGNPLDGGRGLWVGDSESLAYFCASTRVRFWTPAGGVRTFASGFTELGNLYVEPSGDVLVCDRGTHRAYRVSPDGNKKALAGNGKTSGGGDGSRGLDTGLAGVRGIWPVPTGGYLLLTHDGCQLWYLDTAGIIHRLLNGAGGRTHAGDGLPFYSDEPRISEGRSIALDYAGNMLICESDFGFVRRIRFERFPVTD